MEIWGKEKRVKDQLRPKSVSSSLTLEPWKVLCSCLLASCLQDLGGYCPGPASCSDPRQSGEQRPEPSWVLENRLGARGSPLRSSSLVPSVSPHHQFQGDYDRELPHFSLHIEKSGAQGHSASVHGHTVALQRWPLQVELLRIVKGDW